MTATEITTILNATESHIIEINNYSNKMNSLKANYIKAGNKIAFLDALMAAAAILGSITLILI